MKRDWEHINLRNAYKPVPEAFEQAVLHTVRSVSAGGPDQRKADDGRTFRGGARKMAVIVIVSILLIGMAAVYAASRPTLLEWLLGIDGASNQPHPASASLSSLTQDIDGENKADHITIRMNSLAYDGERFSFSYEIGNDAPAFPALVVMEPRFLVNGTPVYLDEFKADGAEPCLAPSPRLDALPVRRNPVVRGGWSRVIPMELNGAATCEMTFVVYRPEKAFAIVPDPDDAVFRLAECAPEQQAEIQDVLDTYGSFQNAILAERDDLDPEKWFRAGYSVIGGSNDPTAWAEAGEEGFDHLTATARIPVTFQFDADIRRAFDFSDRADAALEDCVLHVNRFRLSPLTTEVHIDLLPRENTREAAQALARRYGPLALTDEAGNPVEYAQMEAVYENMPWVSQQEGQWRCRYMMQLPGLQKWPETVRLAANIGVLLSVALPSQ